MTAHSAFSQPLRSQPGRWPTLCMLSLSAPGTHINMVGNLAQRFRGPVGSGAADPTPHSAVGAAVADGRAQPRGTRLRLSAQPRVRPLHPICARLLRSAQGLISRGGATIPARQNAHLIGPIPCGWSIPHRDSATPGHWALPGMRMRLQRAGFAALQFCRTRA